MLFLVNKPEKGNKSMATFNLFTSLAREAQIDRAFQRCNSHLRHASDLEERTITKNSFHLYNCEKLE